MMDVVREREREREVTANTTARGRFCADESDSFSRACVFESDSRERAPLSPKARPLNIGSRRVCLYDVTVPERAALEVCCEDRGVPVPIVRPPRPLSRRENGTTLWDPTLEHVKAKPVPEILKASSEKALGERRRAIQSDTLFSRRPS